MDKYNDNLHLLFKNLNNFHDLNNFIIEFNNINYQDINKNTLLICAIEHRNIDIIDVLLKYDNIDIYHVNNDGENAYITTCKKHDINYSFKIIKYLITKNINISKKDIYNLNGFEYLCKYENIDINLLQYLIDKKSEISMMAIVNVIISKNSHKKYDVLKLLLDNYSSDFLIKDKIKFRQNPTQNSHNFDGFNILEFLCNHFIRIIHKNTTQNISDEDINTLIIEMCEIFRLIKNKSDNSCNDIFINNSINFMENKKKCIDDDCNDTQIHTLKYKMYSLLFIHNLIKILNESNITTKSASKISVA